MSRYFIILSLGFLFSCKRHDSSKINLNDIQAWELSYRMIKSYILEEYDLGIKQFDSLLNSNVNIEPKFINADLEMLHKTNQNKKIIDIFNQLDEGAKVYICGKGFLKNFENTEGEGDLCKNIKIKEEKITHPELQKELVIIYYNDQTKRGADNSALVKQFNLNGDSISYVNTDGVEVTDLISKQREAETNNSKIWVSF
jgi:hypothetical protein